MYPTKNVLWIMADQLRWDYLSCYGHPHLQTPHIDELARKGVRFTQVYVQSPFCGPSRMSYYTGRYCRSHGSTWNGFPLRVGEPTLGDHLRKIGVRPAIVGKTHMVPDLEGMRALGINPDSHIGVYISECGFEPFDRDDGLHPYGPYAPDCEYQGYLRDQGYDSINPWDDHASSGLNESGERVSGWFLKYGNLPADIPEQLSETPYMTRRAIDFMRTAGRDPWLCHLSYIKPHWPYIVPAPYNSMYGHDDIVPPVRTEAEKVDPHPVYKAYIESRICRSFAEDEIRERVIPAYMGLIKQIDDQLGVLFNWMEETGRMKDTMIVMSSDHGDYLGDHWMGEKDLFHDQPVKVPLIIYDPSPEADSTRGMVRDELVEGIDLAPTFLETFGGPRLPHVLEGMSLIPLLHNPSTPSKWRTYAVSEYDYSTREARQIIGNHQEDARLIMIRDERWKYIHAEGFRPMLFDLQTDPKEFHDWGASSDKEHEQVRQKMERALLAWASRHHNRTTLTPQQIEGMLGKEPPGVLIGFWDEVDYEQVTGDSFSDRPWMK